MKIANPISMIDDYVKHIFREHWANLGAEGQMKIFVDRGNNAETWKVVKSFWDGSSENNGRSGCGVLIEGVDRDEWITISMVAVPLSVSTATAAEVMCVLFKDEMKKGENDQMLRNRACPKFDVECVRHSDKRDLRLVPSEIPQNSSRPLPACASLGSAKNSKNHRERDKCLKSLRDR